MLILSCDWFVASRDWLDHVTDRYYEELGNIFQFRHLFWSSLRQN